MANQPQLEHTDALNVYILTYNCARTLIQPSIFAPYLFRALPAASHSPELLVLCLQELAPISYAFLGGSFLTPYFNYWREVVKLASKDHGYVNVVSRNVGMTGLLVFARDDVAENVKWLRNAGVGVGFMEMGNKGAVGSRLGYQSPEMANEVELTFVAAHLAPMEDGLERRNEDYKSIVRRLVFVRDSTSQKPISGDEEDEDAPLLQGDDPSLQDDQASESGMYSASSHLFFAGDLNYRTSLLQPSPQDVDEKFPHPTANEADPKHFQRLLAEDQLTQQVKAGKTLHGLLEAPITFPPTYKYDTDGSKAVIFDKREDGEEDRQHWSWARHRWPSWCDRIFWKDHGSNSDVKVSPQKYTCLPLFVTSDHRPVALAATVPLRALSDAAQRGEGGRKPAASPFSIDPEWRSRRAQARTKELVVGLMAYLTLTWEGNGLLLATVIGLGGGWLIIRSLLMG
ncbi:hypothetical protein H2200_003668 [Cladophialophora chaetospira]|uniref:Inositol polyphosphate-related phosphatase domain-containing protein n=1 Tax=Cladophialophora chaetospira TaxID=386627 RepID=A0AA38XEM7_9EURO|nr:hypothetical protein H2200_003668 [Cladophialophora chaetospira]